MAEASIKLSVVDAASGQVRSLARELANVSKVAKSVGATAEARSLSQGAKQLETVAKNFGQVDKEATRAEKSVSRVSSALGAFTRSLPGGGMGMNLLGLGGVVAFAATAGALVAKSIQLASEFNRVSTLSVYGMTTNAAALTSTLSRFQSTALSMADLGIGGNQAARMAAGFQVASGATPGGAIASLRGIGTYARAYGQDPEALSRQIGMISQNAGPNVGRTAGYIFGAAGQSDALGRRIGELLAVSANALQQIATGTAKRVDIRDALREIVGVASHGGYYSTSAGLATTLSGYSKFGGSRLGDPVGTRLALAAGWSVEDIILGNASPEKKAALARSTYRTFGSNRYAYELRLRQMGMSPDEVRAYMGVAYANHGDIRASDVRRLSAAEAARRAKSYLGTDAGKMDQVGAGFEDAGIRVGQQIIHAVADPLKAISHDTDAMTKELTGEIPMLLKAIAIGVGVSSFGSIAGKVARFFGGGAGAAAARVGGGIAARVAGAGMGVWGGLAGVALGMGAELGQVMGDEKTEAMRLVSKGVPGHVALAIVRASRKTGVPTAILAGVAAQESSFGAGLDRFGRGDGGHGHGIFQVDDRSHPFNVTSRAERDPEFAALYAAQMLASDFKKYGDWRKVLRAYNSGSPNGRTTMTMHDGVMMPYDDSTLWNIRHYGLANPIPRRVMAARTHTEHDAHPAPHHAHSDGHIAPGLPGPTHPTGKQTAFIPAAGGRFEIRFIPGGGDRTRGGTHRTGAYA